MTTIAVAWHSGRLVPSPVPGQNPLDPREFEGWDLHVLRNSSSLSLRSLLLLEEDNGNLVRGDAAALPADVLGIAFIPEFAAVAAPGNALEGGGVRIVPQTGVVTALPNPPTPRLRSFLVRVQVIRQGNPPLVGLTIRVHIHESVTEIWLTPSPLTIADDADGQRLTVLARFDDDTIGDITRLASAPPGTGLPPRPGFAWSSHDNVCVQPDAQGRLTGVFGLFSCTATITATLQQPGWPALSATAEVTVVEPWGQPPPGRAELHLLSGPGETAVAEVPNILLLPDGFLDTKEDRDDFQALASLAVQQLNRNPSTTPFNILEGAINYWSAFVASRERGTTTLNDLAEVPTLFEGLTQAARTPVTLLTVDGRRIVGDRQIDLVRAPLVGGLPAGVHFTVAGDPTLYTTTNATTAQANAVRGVKFTPPLTQIAAHGAVVTIIGRRALIPRGQQAVAGGAAPWTLENLMHVVGLPVPAERIAHGSTPAELNAKIADWTTLYGANRIEPARITNVLYDTWARLLPDHRLADEKDTAFGLANGERPRADGRADGQAITWHPLRTLRTDVDRFLALLSFRGTVVGPTWTFPPSGVPGKDRNLVFILARGVRYAGSNRPEPQPIIALGLVDDETVRVRYGAGRRMSIVSHPLPRDRANTAAVTNFVHATLAHEAAHSYGILDEYGGRPAMPPGGQDERRTFQFGNVTPGREVAVANGITGAGLRWRWPRINNAGVLAGRPVPDPVLANAFRITLAPGRHSGNLRGDLFNVGDVVFLRQRPLFRKPAGNPPVLTPALESPPLRIFAMASDFELQVSIVGGGQLIPGDFAGTGAEAPILFHPEPASAAAAAAGDRYAEVMAQFIRAHITTTGAPLNAAPGPVQPCVPALPPLHAEPQRATNLPPPAAFPGGHPPAIPSRIIGAYEGGNTFSCGIFHPAGACIMRSQVATRTEQPITGLREKDVHSFCHVCRYLLVDHIDPRKHFAIDFFYRWYPQP